MPELPEVELVARGLNVLVSARKILQTDILRERLIPHSTAAEFAEALTEKTINFVHRRGKHILFDLTGGVTLITHLRMSGRFLILSPERDFPKFTHAIFRLDDGRNLVFQDQRHFGMMKFVATNALQTSPEIEKLAPEPFSEEFSFVYFRNILKRSAKNIKEFILDQTKVCGVGNIYASEALFLSKINPKTSANKISAKRADILREKILEVLRASIESGISDDIDPENLDARYYDGGSDDGWFVYDRENEPCRNCETPIKRLKQGARSTYFCPKCQKS